MNLLDRLNQPLFAAGRTKTPLRTRLLHLGAAAFVVGAGAFWLSVPRPACASPAPLDRFSVDDAYAITLAGGDAPLELARRLAAETGVEALTVMSHLRYVSVAATERQITTARCHAAVEQIRAIEAD